MQVSAITSALQNRYDDFVGVINAVPDPEYAVSKNGKWTPAQQLDHVSRALKQIVLAFSLPAFLLRIIFGKANRASRTYDELVARYQQGLQKDYQLSKTFIPAPLSVADKSQQIKRLQKLVSKLCKRVEQIPENKLDTLILPHPLIGKITFREMLYFAIYHAQHHQKQI